MPKFIAHITVEPGENGTCGSCGFLEFDTAENGALFGVELDREWRQVKRCGRCLAEEAAGKNGDT